MATLQTFLADPLVAPVYTVLVLAFANFVLAVYRSRQSGVFDVRKLPEVLDSMVLRLVVPLGVLAFMVFLVQDQAVKALLATPYFAWGAAVIGDQVRGVIAKVTGSYTPTPADT